MVAALMGSLNEHGQTKKSVTAVLTELGLPPRASAALALHLARHLGLFTNDEIDLLVCLIKKSGMRGIAS